MTIVKWLSLGVALSAATALSGSALAADVVVDNSSYDWSGAYVGVQGGYAWGDTHPTFNAVSSADINVEGVIGGVEAGYNMQTGNVVLGFEADASLAGIDGTLVAGPNTPCILPVGSLSNCAADVDWLVTARARAGFAIDNVMPFITGGLAFGGVKGTFDWNGAGACECWVDDTVFGFVIGGGVEWAINESWSTKAEFLYVNLGKPSISGDNTAFVPGVGADNYEFSTARVGINFAF